MIRRVTAAPPDTHRGCLALDERRPWDPDPPLSSLTVDFDLTGPEEEGLSRAERRCRVRGAASECGGTVRSRWGDIAALDDEVVRELAQGRPVIILLTLSRAFNNPSPEGIIHPATGEAPEPQRRHAAVAVGHGRVDPHRAVLVRNSWGERWGDAAYGWLTEPSRPRASSR